MNIELRALRSWVIKRVGSWQLNQSRRCFFILCSRPLFSELFSISLLFRIIWTPEITGPIGIIKCQPFHLSLIRVDTRFVWRMKKKLIRWPIPLFKRSWRFQTGVVGDHFDWKLIIPLIMIAKVDGFSPGYIFDVGKGLLFVPVGVD